MIVASRVSGEIKQRKENREKKWNRRKTTVLFHLRKEEK